MSVRDVSLPLDELLDFVENASIALHWVNSEGIIIWANQTELDTLGFSRDEYIGMPISNFHADSGIIQDILSRLGNNETLINYKARLKCKDGTIKHVLINSSVYRKEEKFMHTRCFTQDVTDMVLAEEKRATLMRKLGDSENLRQISADIIASSYDAIISKDFLGRVTSWNRAAEDTFGYTAEEMIGNFAAILIPSDRADEEQQIFEKLKAGQRIDHFRTKRITKAKKVLDVSLTISPIYNQQSQIVGLSKIVRDITFQQQEESRKNDFVGMVSHELKTPLTSILAYVQVLLGKAKKNGDEFGINALTKTERQARKMINMVQDFLNIGRLEEGKIRLNPESFEISLLIKELINEITITNDNHLFIFENTSVAWVYADRDKIGQVINNLITNAIKYSPPGSPITIICKADHNCVHISVVDKGIGITTKDQLHLFDRYYRVEQEKMLNVAGFGIGLYLVAEILKLHQTTIQVTSKKGEGSTFQFTMPTMQIDNQHA